MSLGTLIAVLFILTVLGFMIGRMRALSCVDGDARKLHSLPNFYGGMVAIFIAFPAFLILCAWLVVQPMLIESKVRGTITTAEIAEGSSRAMVMADVRRISQGLDAALKAGGMSEKNLIDFDTTQSDANVLLSTAGVALGSKVQPSVFEAGRQHRILTKSAQLGMVIIVLSVALLGFTLSWRRITPKMRARNVVERAILWGLIASSLVAIMTTIGIIASMVFETVNFFQMYPVVEFFTTPVWNPQFRGGSELGILPLLWGTLYVSFVALIVAVPIGLFVAIYLSEYAGTKLRAFAKPAIEILAGIPSIVYGLFALITIGPWLRDYFAQPLGLGNSSSSVITAGIAMGIMLIPFISSLSDDIINAVPQSLRDGSYALGATQSETIRQVVVPAALPGIVGAILMGASRAIGETMIVVLGAGASAKLSINPFEAMTTITVKIVSQLTGDTEFNSPETLVAFALGITLFVFTLLLNVLALAIVRKYSEQYE
ncbi:MAG: phosphate ABC transporter permease subunit PstC [Paracoccaceae bacterium]